MARDTEYILKLIEEHGMATAQDIFAAREAALNSDDIVDPVDVLLKQGKIQENELLSMLAQQYGWEFVDLNDFDIDPSVIDSLSVDIAQLSTRGSPGSRAGGRRTPTRAAATASSSSAPPGSHRAR